MGFLTDRAFITGITKSNIFHVVDVNDTSQGNPDGSSYKGSINQLIVLLNTEFVKITGDTMSGPLLLPSLTANTSTIGTLNVTGQTNTNILSASTAYTETLFINSTPSTNITDSTVLIRNTSTGEIEEKDLSHYVFGFFVQTGDSVTVSNTTTESNVLDGGVGSLSVPPNYFKVGDSFHVKIGGVVSALNGASLIFRIKSGSVVLGSDSITFTNGVTSRPWEFRCDFTVRSIGATTVASILSNGTFSYNVSSDVYGAGFDTLNNTTFDTTILNDLSFTVEWGTASTSNSIYSTMCILNKLY